MITESILSNFNTINEEIHLPHGTKSAKIVTHKDLDGVCSGITLIQQLVKQGIPKERIQVTALQYGDKNQADKLVQDKKGQFVGVTDYAKLPKVNPFEVLNQLQGFNANKSTFTNDWKFILSICNKSFKDFKKEMISKFNIKENKFTNASLTNLQRAAKTYSESKDKENITVNSEIKVINPDFVADHHANAQGALSGGKNGEIAVDSPSEAARLASKYAPGFWPKEDLAAISMVDSAGYNMEQLENTIFLKKYFGSKDRRKNLAALTACIVDNMAKKDPEAFYYVIKNSGPNLVSLYSTALKASNFNKERMAYITALKNNDFEAAREINKRIPADLMKSYNRSKEGDLKPVMGLDDWRKKNLRDLEIAKTGYKTRADEAKLAEIKGKRGPEFKKIRDEIGAKKGPFRIYNNFNLQEATLAGGFLKNYPSRYLSSLYSEEGQRAPYTLRRYETFMQTAKNPLYKGDVDFAEVFSHVINDIEKSMLDNGLPRWKVEKVLKAIKKDSGGHKGIFSFQGFEEIKPNKSDNDDPLSKLNGKEEGLGDKYYKALELSKKGNKSALVQNILDRKNAIADKYKEIRKKVMDDTVRSIIGWTNKLYPVKPELLDTLKVKDDTFEKNKTSTESET